MPWEKGQSGNPNGSRGRKIMSDALSLALNRAADVQLAKEIAGDDINPNEIKRLHVIADQLAKKAQDGDMVAIKEVFDRIDGKVAQTIAGDQDSPIRQVFEILDRRSLEQQGKQLTNGHDKANDRDPDRSPS